MNKKLLLSFLIIVAILISGCVNQKRPEHNMTLNNYKCKDCNVILITFEALRADKLGIYGSKKNLTPNIDEFAENAIIFSKTSSNAYFTHASVSSMFSSKLPSMDYINADRLKEEDYLIPFYLNKEDYDTISYTNNIILSNNFIKGFKETHDGLNSRPYNSEPIDKTLSEALKRINETKKPFFLWMHFIEVHDPYSPDKSYFYDINKNSYDTDGLYDELESKEFHNYMINHSNKYKGASCLALIYLSKKINKSNETQKYILPPEDCNVSMDKHLLNLLIDSYDAYVKQTDDKMMPLFSYYNNNLKNDTILILTSDHGESLGEHNFITHNNLHYKTLNIPIIIKIPGTQTEIIENRVSLVDLTPTILDILEIDYTKQGLRGENMFFKKNDSINLAMGYQGNNPTHDSYTIMVGDYKYFKNETYNIKNDPFEEKPLDKNTVYIKDLEIIKKSIKTEADYPKDTNLNLSQMQDNSLKEKLQALGYIN